MSLADWFRPRRQVLHTERPGRFAGARRDHIRLSATLRNGRTHAPLHIPLALHRIRFSA